MNKLDLGAVTAYAMAVEQGYEGTEEEFAALQAESGNNAVRAEAAADRAQQILDSIPLDFQEVSQGVATLTEEIAVQLPVGGDYDGSILDMKHRKIIRKTFTPGIYTQETNEFVPQPIGTAVRAYINGITSEDTLYIYTGKDVYYQVFSYTDEPGSYQQLQPYSNVSPFVLHPEAGKKYAVVAMNAERDDTTPITAEFLQTIRASLRVYAGVLDPEEVVPTSRVTNIWGTEPLVDGTYYYHENGTEMENKDMVTTKINVRPNTKYYFTNGYLQIVWLDKYGNFISGEYVNNENANSQSVMPWQTVTSPDNAYYARLSTRTGNRDSFMFSEHEITHVDAARISDYRIARSNVQEESNVILDFDCKENRCPSSLTPNGFTDNGDGYHKATSAATYRMLKLTALDRSKISMVFKGEAGKALTFRLGYDPAEFGLTVNTGGLCIEVNSAAKKLTAYTCYWGDASTFVKVGEASFASNIADGTDWYLSAEKVTVNKVKVEMYNMLCPDEIVSLELDSTPTGTNGIYRDNYMRCWGGLRVSWVSGVLYVKRLRMESTGNRYARTYIVGDSYVETAGRDPQCSYGQRLYDATGGNVILSGRGGATADDVLKRLTTELNVVHPRYCILQCGMNDSLGDLDVFQEKLQACITAVERCGIIPILCTIPRRMDSDNLAFIQMANPWIRSLGYKYIDQAVAMSTGDGVTQDTSKYVDDRIHPNVKGGECLYRCAQAMLPEMF